LVKLKLKLNSQPTQYWENKFNKDNFKKTCGGNTVAKQKPCKGNTVVIHSIFFFKKSYKANLSTSSIYKKNRQRLSKKTKKAILGKRNEKKSTKKETKAEKKTRRESYSVLKKKTKKLKFQPTQ
jgi:hypothetical protein